jgi:SAM-dependent methyltransferase
MFHMLEEIRARPRPFAWYTADELWTDEYPSRQMPAYHLNGDVDISSRKFSFIDRSADWTAARFNLRKGKSVVDFGCGPGLYTQRLARTGAAVTGIDFSGNPIAYAREKAREEKTGYSICPSELSGIPRRRSIRSCAHDNVRLLRLEPGAAEIPAGNVPPPA